LPSQATPELINNLSKLEETSDKIEKINKELDQNTSAQKALNKNYSVDD